MSKEEFDEYITWEERVLDKLERWVKYNKPITRKQAEETIDFICEQYNVIERKDKEIERLHSIIKEVREYIKNKQKLQMVWGTITLGKESQKELLEILDKEKI